MYTNLLGETLIFRAPVPRDIRSIMDKLTIGEVEVKSDSDKSDVRPISYGLIDDDGYLITSTDVTGKTFDRSQRSGFVPSDRVIPEEV
jgi:hypothetical protein